MSVSHRNRIRTFAITSILMAAVLAVLVGFGTSDLSAEDSESSQVVTSTFHVSGMTCGGCEVGVRRVVTKLEGVESVEASYEEEQAVVTYNQDKVTPEQIVEAIKTLGYEAELQRNEDEDA